MMHERTRQPDRHRIAYYAMAKSLGARMAVLKPS